jgi:hypothetical protein
MTNTSKPVNIDDAMRLWDRLNTDQQRNVYRTICEGIAEYQRTSRLVHLRHLAWDVQCMVVHHTNQPDLLDRMRNRPRTIEEAGGLADTTEVFRLLAEDVQPVTTKDETTTTEPPDAVSDDYDTEAEMGLSPAERVAASELDYLIRLVLRKLAYRHPHWPPVVRDDIKHECDGELYLVEEITEYREVVRLVGHVAPAEVTG